MNKQRKTPCVFSLTGVACLVMDYMLPNDSASHTSTSSHMLRDIKDGLGEWNAVPSCVRETLLTILNSPARDLVSETPHPAPRTLLPLRRGGPKTDISDALDAVCEAYRPPTVFVPNLQSVVRSLGEGPLQRHQMSSSAAAAPALREAISTCNDADDSGDQSDKVKLHEPVGCRVQEPRLLPERRVYYGSVQETQSNPSERNSRTLPRSSGGGTASQKKGPRVVRPIAMNTPTIKGVECTRHRRDVTNALLAVHKEVVQLQTEADTSLVKAVYDAMRLDPRRVKDVYGEVKPAQGPTREQEEALAAFAEGLAVLQEATRELVSAFLSQEEKRHLGVDTHKFQTRAERSNTYQYVAPRATRTKHQLLGAKKGNNLNATAPTLDNICSDSASENPQRFFSRLAGLKGAFAGEDTAAVGNNDTAGVVRTPDAPTPAKLSSKLQKHRPSDLLLTSSLDSTLDRAKGKTAPKQSSSQHTLGAGDVAVSETTGQKKTTKKTSADFLIPPKTQTLSLTLSVNSLSTGGKSVKMKDTTASERAGSVEPVVSLKSRIEQGKIDIKRFLIDSDSDSGSL